MFSVITDSDMMGDDPYQCEGCTSAHCRVGMGYARGDGSASDARGREMPRWLCEFCYASLPTTAGVDAELGLLGKQARARRIP